jgi:hypothetical protein
MSRKVRKTLTLDPDVVAALGDDPTALSATVNTILVDEIGRREQHAALGRFLDRLDAEYGPADLATVDRVRELLS